MNPRKPPALATWLLKRSGIANRNIPLDGDLLEEFQTGRSAAWYWRQTLMAIATGMCRDVWMARGYFGAFSIGYAAQVCVAFVLRRNSWPTDLHGIAYTILGAVMAIFFVGAISLRLWARRDAKASARDLLKVESSVEFVLFATVAFGCYLTMHCLVALLWRQSFREWVLTELIWFLGFVVPDLARLSRSQPREE